MKYFQEYTLKPNLKEVINRMKNKTKDENRLKFITPPEKRIGNQLHSGSDEARQNSKG